MMLVDQVTYRPKDAGNAQAIVTLGFVKDAAEHIDVSGFNVYHKNRLIRPFWRIWNSSDIRGRGIIAILEANFVEPAHDKQGFERTIVLTRLEARLIEMQKSYWNKHCHKIGYTNASMRKTVSKKKAPASGMANSLPAKGRVTKTAAAKVPMKERAAATVQDSGVAIDVPRIEAIPPAVITQLTQEAYCNPSILEVGESNAVLGCNDLVASGIVKPLLSAHTHPIVIDLDSPELDERFEDVALDMPYPHSCDVKKEIIEAVDLESCILSGAGNACKTLFPSDTMAGSPKGNEIVELADPSHTSLPLEALKALPESNRLQSCYDDGVGCVHQVEASSMEHIMESFPQSKDLVVPVLLKGCSAAPITIVEDDQQDGQATVGKVVPAGNGNTEFPNTFRSSTTCSEPPIPTAMELDGFFDSLAPQYDASSHTLLVIKETMAWSQSPVANLNLIGSNLTENAIPINDSDHVPLPGSTESFYKTESTVDNRSEGASKEHGNRVTDTSIICIEDAMEDSKKADRDVVMIDADCLRPKEFFVNDDEKPLFDSLGLQNDTSLCTPPTIKETEALCKSPMTKLDGVGRDIREVTTPIHDHMLLSNSTEIFEGIESAVSNERNEGASKEHGDRDIDNIACTEDALEHCIKDQADRDAVMMHIDEQEDEDCPSLGECFVKEDEKPVCVSLAHPSKATSQTPLFIKETEALSQSPMTELEQIGPAITEIVSPNNGHVPFSGSSEIAGGNDTIVSNKRSEGASKERGNKDIDNSFVRIEDAMDACNKAEAYRGAIMMVVEETEDEDCPCPSLKESFMDDDEKPIFDGLALPLDLTSRTPLSIKETGALSESFMAELVQTGPDTTELAIPINDGVTFSGSTKIFEGNESSVSDERNEGASQEHENRVIDDSVVCTEDAMKDCNKARAYKNAMMMDVEEQKVEDCSRLEACLVDDDEKPLLNSLASHNEAPSHTVLSVKETEASMNKLDCAGPDITELAIPINAHVAFSGPMEVSGQNESSLCNGRNGGTSKEHGNRDMENTVICSSEDAMEDCNKEQAYTGAVMMNAEEKLGEDCLRFEEYCVRGGNGKPFVNDDEKLIDEPTNKDLAVVLHVSVGSLDCSSQGAACQETVCVSKAVDAEVVAPVDIASSPCFDLMDENRLEFAKQQIDYLHQSIEAVVGEVDDLREQLERHRELQYLEMKDLSMELERALSRLQELGG